MPTASRADSSVPKSDDPHADAAQLYAHQVAAFRIHAGVFAASVVLVFGVNLITNLAAGIAGEWSAWWSILVLLGWGVGVTVHGLVVRVSRPSTIGSVSPADRAGEVPSSDRSEG